MGDYLSMMGVQRWLSNVEPSVDTKQTWQYLQQQVASCQACGLQQTRTQTVFGVGCQQAQCLVVGEAPGADEDRQGEPFVGRAGQLLNEMLLAFGFTREQVYIANILKCRPPNNRDPHVNEIASCQHFLQSQIALLAPSVIVAVGRIAAQNLLERPSSSLSALRNCQHIYQDTNIPVIVTYHPAYLLRTPIQKRKAWQDWLTVRDILLA